MRVNSIDSFSYNRQNSIEKQSVSAQNFGTLKFKDKAYKSAVEGMKNLIDIKVESDNLYSAEKAIRKWFKMFTEPWDLRVARHEHLPKFVQQFDDTIMKKIYRDAIPKYNEHLANLGKEADDLTVEVIDRVAGKNNEIAYTVNVPAMNVKNKVFTITPNEKTNEFSMCGVPTENEINLLKMGIYEEVVGKDIASLNNPGYDIYGKFDKLIETMNS